MIELRPYQLKSIEGLRNSLRTGHKRPLLVSPTGSGKSITYGAVIKGLLENGKTVLWAVHRRNLVFAMQEKLKEKFGIEAGIIMAGVEPDLEKPIQLCSIQTYSRRLNLEDLAWNRFFVKADCLMLDEGHHAISRTYKEIIKLYHGKIIIGCTATPIGSGGRGMGEVFDDLVIGPTVKELTEQGYLSQVRYFVPNQIDLDGVPIYAGDYAVGALGDRMSGKKLIGDVVENWLKNGDNRKTLVYSVNVKHSIALCEAFERAGVRVARLDAKSSDEERDEVFDKMERGDITVLVNVALYLEGLDVPSIQNIVFARPTKSFGLYRQAGGRGLRVEEGKDNLRFFDHANVVSELGLLDWDIEWTLDGKERAYSKPKRETVKKMVKCRACGLVFEGSSICPDCGSAIQSFGQDIETAEGELEELERKNEKKRVDGPVEKRIFLGMLKHYIPRQKNPNPKRIYGIFKSKYGEWPSRAYSDVAPIEPDSTFKSYMKYVNIKWAKRRNK